MRPTVRVLALVAFALAVVATRASAGTTGGLSGYLAWESGQPLAGVDVWVCSPSDVEVAKTNSRGFYSFITLAPGTYTIFFREPNADATINLFQGVKVAADQITTQDARVCPVIMSCDHVGPGPLQERTSSAVWTIDDEVVPIRFAACVA